MNVEAKVKINISDNDWDFITRYLEMWARKSPGSARTRKSAICRLLSYANRGTLMAITSDDVEAYLTTIDRITVKRGGINQPVRLNYKRTQLALLRSFFKAFSRKARRELPTYISPVPEGGTYQFSPDPAPSLVEREKALEEQAFTIPQLLRVLQGLYYEVPNQHYNKVPRESFMIGALLTVCGPRISEVCSIALDDVNIKEGYFRTGIADNARKNNSDGATPLYFCFPDVVANLLSIYIRNLKLVYPSTEWLFPSIYPTKHLPTRSYMLTLSKLGLPFPVKTHTFRRTFETFQARNGVPLHYIEVLSNHAITSVVMRHYVQITLSERRALSEKYFPQEYRPIIEWLDSL
ncbi:MAG: hypothetical protein RBG13Loki_0654 [Promethearchaeota archaeon CR_4]|nr:MAG: hypothetical protein RBG13Loki_0654 [Candidatus Lokiarchaeota archaeon CR_4]